MLGDKSKSLGHQTKPLVARSAMRQELCVQHLCRLLFQMKAPNQICAFVWQRASVVGEETGRGSELL